MFWGNGNCIRIKITSDQEKKVARLNGIIMWQEDLKVHR